MPCSRGNAAVFPPTQRRMLLPPPTVVQRMLPGKPSLGGRRSRLPKAANSDRGKPHPSPTRGALPEKKCSATKPLPRVTPLGGNKR
jgi:hypothetical protein